MTDWNAIWDEVEDEQQRRLRATMLATGGLTPERAAQFLGIAAQSYCPEALTH